MQLITKALHIASKNVGVKMQVLDYLDESEASKKVLLDYQKKMLIFIEKPVDKKGLPAVAILQEIFLYNKDNIADCYCD